GQVPGKRIIETGRADLAGHPIVEHLPDARHEVAVLPEQLRQGDHIRQRLLPEVRLEFEDARLVGTKAGQERDAAWATQRELRISPLEPHRAPGQSIDIRRANERIAVTTE